ncbi:hypothetical protein F5Y08DRAFT_237503 [Xylaria arbuscula]|nr:hypothetical protein F5Y08DRAFT_237503 [Xylaria arbuscula]
MGTLKAFKAAILASSAHLAILGNICLALPKDVQVSIGIPQPHILEKRDAYTCHGGDANITDCRAALAQVQSFENQDFEVYSGVCLNWPYETCNVRFCAQPYVTKTVNRTAAWIYHWANNTLLGCLEGGQYAVMGDSANLNGNGGTYRLYIELAGPRHS